MSERRTTGSPTEEAGRYSAWIAVAFSGSTLSSVALAVVYALGGQPQLEGLLLGGTLGGLALGFVLWGKHLMPQGPFVEERAPMPSEAEDRVAFERDYRAGERGIRRRTFLGRMLLGALAAMGAALLFPIRSLGPAPQGTLFRTAWRPGARLVTPEGEPVGVDDLPVGGILTVYPEGHVDAADSQTVLIRLPSTTFRPPPGRESWSPQGYAAYSKICTHAGCPVGLFEQASNSLFCPCHQSEFDVTDQAKPTAGPATRALPQLPLEVDAQGFLRAQGDFPEPVGPAFWNLP